MNRRRRLASGGGCARKTVSLSADTVERVEVYLDSTAGNGVTFSAFVADALDARLDQFNIKKKAR